MSTRTCPSYYTGAEPRVRLGLALRRLGREIDAREILADVVKRIELAPPSSARRRPNGLPWPGRRLKSDSVGSFRKGRRYGFGLTSFRIRNASIRDRRGEGVGARTAWTAAGRRADGACCVPADGQLESRNPRRSGRRGGICALAARRATRGQRSQQARPCAAGLSRAERGGCAYGAIGRGEHAAGGQHGGLRKRAALRSFHSGGIAAGCRKVDMQIVDTRRREEVFQHRFDLFAVGQAVIDHHCLCCRKTSPRACGCAAVRESRSPCRRSDRLRAQKSRTAFGKAKRLDDVRS